MQAIHYETNTLFYPFQYAARHLKAAYAETEWRGRIVHVILAALEMIPLLNYIIAIADRALFAQKPAPRAPTILEAIHTFTQGLNVGLASTEQSDAAILNMLAIRGISTLEDWNAFFDICSVDYQMPEVIEKTWVREARDLTGHQMRQALLTVSQALKVTTLDFSTVKRDWSAEYEQLQKIDRSLQMKFYIGSLIQRLEQIKTVTERHLNYVKDDFSSVMEAHKRILEQLKEEPDQLQGIIAELQSYQQLEHLLLLRLYILQQDLVQTWRALKTTGISGLAQLNSSFLELFELNSSSN